MGKFINIGAGKRTPMLMDIENISVIVEQIEKQDKEDAVSIGFHDLEQGRFLVVDTQNWELETDKVVSKIKRAGTDLFELPFYWGDGQKIGRYFINPALVQSIIVSGPREKEGEPEPYVGLLVDVKGYGRVETYKAPVSEVHAFVKAVRVENPHMMCFYSEQVSTRWGSEGYTMIDPTEIRSVFPNGWDMDIKFNDGMRLDFSLDNNGKVSAACDDYLNRLAKRIQGNGTSADLKAAVGGDLENLRPRLNKFEEKYRRTLREDFAAAVTAHVPDIVKIQNASDVYYTKLDRVSWLHNSDDRIAIHFRKVASEQFGDDMVVHFESQQAALSEMERITQLMDNASPR